MTDRADKRGWQQGYMYKLGEKGLIKSFKRRWFVLDSPAKRLYYYKAKDRFGFHSLSDSQPPEPSKLQLAGHIDLSCMKSAQTTGYSSNSRRYGLTVKLPHRVYVLEASQKADADMWADIIQKSIATAPPVPLQDKPAPSPPRKPPPIPVAVSREFEPEMGTIPLSRTPHYDIPTVQPDITVFNRARSGTLREIDDLMDEVKERRRELSSGGAPAMPTVEVVITDDSTVPEVQQPDSTNFAEVSLDENPDQRLGVPRLLRALSHATNRISPARGLSPSVRSRTASETSPIRRAASDLIFDQGVAAMVAGVAVMPTEEFEAVGLSLADDIVPKPAVKDEPIAEVTVSYDADDFEAVGLVSDEFMVEKKTSTMDVTPADEGSLTDMGDMNLEGFLMKRSTNVLDRWQRRYFVLNQSTLLYYHNRPTPEAPMRISGNLPLGSILAIRPCDLATEFEVVLPSRVYALQASTREMRDKWIEATRIARHICINGPAAEGKPTNLAAIQEEVDSSRLNFAV